MTKGLTRENGHILYMCPLVTIQEEERMGQEDLHHHHHSLWPVLPSSASPVATALFINAVQGTTGQFANTTFNTTWHKKILNIYDSTQKSEAAVYRHAGGHEIEKLTQHTQTARSRKKVLPCLSQLSLICTSRRK